MTDSNAIIATQVSDTYAIPVSSFARFEKDIERLARRAKRLGFTAPTFEVVGTITKKKSTIYAGAGLLPETITRSVECRQVRIIDAQFGVKGFSFVATLEHVHGGGGTIVHAKPGEKVPACYGTARPLCDHCNTIRNRLETFVLREDATGTYKQVGRNCLADYLGRDAERVAMSFQALVDATSIARAYSDESSFEERGVYQKFSLLASYLPVVAQVVMDHGFVSLKKAQEDESLTTTRSRADRAFGGHDKAFKLTEAATKLANEVIDWAENLPEAEGDDDGADHYLPNIGKIARSRIVTDKQRGIVASMITAFRRATAPKANASSEYVGTVGQKIVVGVTVRQVIAVRGYATYHHESTAYLHLMNDADGNEIVWKSSGTKLEEGVSYVLRGTVKKQSEYREVKQTTLTRCEEVSYRRWIATVAGAEHEIQAENEKDAKDRLKAKLGVARLPKGVSLRVEE
jgi:hypothetical protein